MSSLRTKVEQKTHFTGTETSRPPQRKAVGKGKKREHEAASTTDASSSAQPLFKRPKSLGISSQRLMDSFFQSMRDHITRKARPVIGSKIKIDALKTQLLAVKRLPPGIIGDAEKICQCAKNELKNHLEHHGTMQNFQYFQKYVKEHFDAIALSLQPQASTSASAGESASTPSTPVMAPADSSVALLRRDLSAVDMASSSSSASGAPSQAALYSISHAPSDISMVDDLPEDEDYRTCTVSFKSLLRTDVPPNLVESFLQKLNAAMYDVSDYIMGMQLVVFTLMVSMKSLQLVSRGGDGGVQMKKARGFQIHDILPADYEMKIDAATSAPPPLPSSALKSATFCNGAKTSHSTFDALSSANVTVLETISRDTPRHSSELMKVALSLYKTNLKNMWAKNKLFNKALNKLLEILLRIHLAPKRESHYQKLKEKRAKKQQAKKQAKKEIVKSRRNTFRNALRSEKYKLQRYQRKAQGKPEGNNWARLAEQGQDRINRMYADFKRAKEEAAAASGQAPDPASSSTAASGTSLLVASSSNDPDSTFDAVAASTKDSDVDIDDVPIDELLPHYEVLDKEDEEGEQGEQAEEERGKQTGSRDLPRRRILVLKAVLRKLLVKQAGKAISHAELKKERRDITDDEARVCLLLSEILLLYIPAKGHYSYIGFQLPFVLLANDIFRAVGYGKFAVDLCPTSSCGSLYAMRLDAPSVYTLCTKGDDPVDVFDFEGFHITSVGEARAHKHAMFNTFFDIRAIFKACDAFGLTFANNLTILPGLSSVRILGTKKNSSKPAYIMKKPLDIDWKFVNDAQSKTDEELRKDIDTLEADMITVSEELKYQSKGHNHEEFSSKIKQLNRQRGTERTLHDRDPCSEIADLKTQRYQSFLAVKRTKQQLSRLRSRAFLTRKAIEYRNKEIPAAAVTDPPPSDQELNAMVFSGTDNGLTVMTETVPMDINKYKYHLSLHNRFSPLANLDINEGDGSEGANAATADIDKDGDQASGGDSSGVDALRGDAVAVDTSAVPQTHDDDAASDGASNHSATFQPLPTSYKMRAEDVDFGSGQFTKRQIILKAKRTTEQWKQVQQMEEQLKTSSVFRAKHVEDVMSNLAAYRNNGPALRSFYHSKKMTILSNKVEHTDVRFRSRFASRERSFCAGGRPQTHLTMFIGDRGLCVGSRLKGHMKYGGKWKPRLHSSVAKVHTTNEHKTSQTCMYCFGPTSHPVQAIKAKNGNTRTKLTNGAFLCLNPECVSVVNHRAIQGRDRTSAMAIAVSGLSSLLFNQPLPVFNPKPSQSNTGIISKTTSFCNRNETRDGSGAASSLP
ncbi:hypothetical protein MUCCIDRAFT_112793 [Mucor lusitanicus CBS 277.49]|uniref:Uncharacterized protein n=3 Tax=Mucor circinelloides f. lusitanicus TaxID=29924 RepID=A0A162QEG8_MUCCL|nr:hypothetical protein MUCCIDRAFT_112793 [Mucor lusitanicus CBS 277.49]